MATVSEVLTRAAAKLDKGVCRGANARLSDGKACGVFDQRAASYSMYGALCSVLGPGLGDDKALQASPAWKLIALRAWAVLSDDGAKQPGTWMAYALHDLYEETILRFPKDAHTRAAGLLRKWAAEDEIKALGEWS